MTRKQHDNILTFIFSLIIVFTLIISGYLFYKQNQKWKSIHNLDKERRLKIKNAQCKVLRENSEELIGVICNPIENNIWEVKTLTGKFIMVHGSRIRPNGENNLIMPYKGDN